LCTITQNVTVDRGPLEAPRPAASVEQLRGEWLAWNAAQPDPLPVCRYCGYPFLRRDRDPFDHRVCMTCGAARTEDAVRRLFKAKGRKAREKALRRLLSIAK
jgi:hypothetical protein